MNLLNQEEIDMIATKIFPTDRLCVIRDISCLVVTQVLHMPMLKKLKRSEVATGLDGEKWDFNQRKKNRDIITDTLIETRFENFTKTRKQAWG